MSAGLYKKILDAVRFQIQQLDLPGIRDDEIMIEEKPADKTIVRQGVIITRDKERFGKTCPIGMDQVGYPCVITVNEGEAKDAEGIEDETDIRILIRQAFHRKREPMYNRITDSDIWILPCVVDFGPVNLSEFWEENWSTSQLVIWCWFNEIRTGLCE